MRCGAVRWGGGAAQRVRAVVGVTTRTGCLAAEADLALESGAQVVGVNNRDLRDFTVDLATTERLAPRLVGATLVAESGVKTLEDGRRLRDAGADAVLVGEAAMREPALVAKLSVIS